MIDIHQLANIYNTTHVPILEPYLDPLNNTMTEYDISNIHRTAMFMAMVGVESRNLQTIIENLNYSADRLLVVFPNYFNRLTANKASGNPERIANTVYANRMGNR